MRHRPLEVRKFEDSRRLGKLIQQSCRKDPGHIISHQEIATRSNRPSDRVRCAYISFNAKQGKLAGFRIPAKKEPLGAPGGGQGSMVTVFFPLYLISFLAAFLKVCSTDSRLPP